MSSKPYFPSLSRQYDYVIYALPRIPTLLSPDLRVDIFCLSWQIDQDGFPNHLYILKIVLHILA